jgi:hypothetical protein
MATERENRAKTLERGNLYFFYRPRVEEEHPEGLGDVQRMYMVLAPHGKKKYRLSVIGRKRLPDPEQKGDRVWGFIDVVETDPKRLVRQLQEVDYETKTRGMRHQPAARPAGEGVYRILRHDDHTHFAYALELPRRTGEVQKELGVDDEASYIISVKNPDAPAPPGVGLESRRHPDYPKELADRIGGRRFVDADPPGFLDYEGTEFVLIAAADDVEQELGIDLGPQRENVWTAEIFNDLRLERSKQPIEPLVEGEWE